MIRKWRSLCPVAEKAIFGNRESNQAIARTVNENFSLDDLSLTPVDQLKGQRATARLEAVPSLAERLAIYRPEAIVSIMRGIDGHVKEAMRLAGSTAEFHGVPFLGNGHQTKFAIKMALIIRSLPRNAQPGSPSAVWATVATSDPIELTAEIISAFVSNNSLQKGELPALIELVHAAVKRLADGGDVAPAGFEPQAREPAVSVRKSVTPDYLISLDDGKQFKSLRRHLSALGMTPEQYRMKWSLPFDYPMVAANYAAQRSELAKKLGLGQSRKGGRPRKLTG